jgi:hypothetical protein
VKAWHVLVCVLPLAALAMLPQDPAATPTPPATEPVATASISELQYVSLQGTATVVAARNLTEIRLIEDRDEHICLELVYENGDYSLVQAQAFHLLRNGTGTREIRFVRCKQDRMRFPRLP